MKTLLLLATAALVLFAATRLLADDFMDPTEAARRVEQGSAILIDVREPAEWADTGVATPAVLLPLSDLRGDRTQWKSFLAKHAGKELIVYCRSGTRSGIATKLLTAEGHTVANAGAFKHWQDAGLPVRQVEAR
ncbi:MAG TPA: rhodanese-like domain-containing protein [Opitutaceae bacterium]|nr:rhodanese-like domain-containing protein [Opitutaceae bacterium]HRJ48327.1 rhodanese-like domain-containing protein [Opitutaceae bacterium]